MYQETKKKNKKKIWITTKLSIKPAKAWDFPENFTGKLSNIKGSPSDEYKADILDDENQKVGVAHNHMDRDEWYCQYKK